MAVRLACLCQADIDRRYMQKRACRPSNFPSEYVALGMPSCDCCVICRDGERSHSTALDRFRAHSNDSLVVLLVVKDQNYALRRSDYNVCSDCQTSRPAKVPFPNFGKCLSCNFPQF